MSAEQERVDQVNQISNGFGQTLLTITDGDWDLALSVAGNLLASCIAQATLDHGDEIEHVFNETGKGVFAATMAFYAELKKVDEENGN